MSAVLVQTTAVQASLRLKEEKVMCTPKKKTVYHMARTLKNERKYHCIMWRNIFFIYCQSMEPLEINLGKATLSLCT